MVKVSLGLEFGFRVKGVITALTLNPNSNPKTDPNPKSKQYKMTPK